jgi:hypothetical protein
MYHVPRDMHPDVPIVLMDLMFEKDLPEGHAAM